MVEFKGLNRFLLACMASVALSACGGSGSSDSGSTPPPGSGSPPPGSSDPPPEAAGISGVAAVGAPLVGTVTVRDALGATKTVAIGSNGSYSVDVTGMTAPFVFRARGTAAGRDYVVHSAAAAADVNGTINITQLTELIVDNIAGQLASAYFDNGDFNSLSKSALDAESDKLKEKLLPVLLALGVDAGTDLLRTQFTPLSSALDSALDILRVSVDSAANVATITNIVTQQQIQDDLLVAAAGEASPAQLNDVTGVGEGVSDLALIKTALSDFTAKFAAGSPAEEIVASSLTSTFLLDDEDAAMFAADLSASPWMVGASFTDVHVWSIDYTDLTQVTADIEFTAKDANGRLLDRLRSFKMLKGVDGVWRLHGNRRALQVDAKAHMVRNVGAFNCRSTGIEFEIDDLDETNNGVDIDHFVITGPGLPADGLRYTQAPLGGYWRIDGRDTPYYVMANSCNDDQVLGDAAIAAIPDTATYVWTAYSSADDSVKAHLPGGAEDGTYRVELGKRPLTLAEVVATDAFPTITTPVSSAELLSYAGGAFEVTATGMNPNGYADVFLRYNTADGEQQSADDYLAPNADGELSTTLSLLPPDEGNPIVWRELRVNSEDPYLRRMLTVYSGN